MNDLEIQSLGKIAELIVERKLESAAVFLLELHKPLVTVGYTFVLVSMPLINIIFGSKLGSGVLEVLKSRESVDALINLIEKRAEHVGS